MLRNVFLKSLRDQRRSLMFWGIGVAVLSLVTILFYPAVKDAPAEGTPAKETAAESATVPAAAKGAGS